MLRRLRPAIFFWESSLNTFTTGNRFWGQFYLKLVQGGGFCGSTGSSIRHKQETILERRKGSIYPTDEQSHCLRVGVQQPIMNILRETRTKFRRFRVRRPVVQKTFRPKCAVSIVARVVRLTFPRGYKPLFPPVDTQHTQYPC